MRRFTVVALIAICCALCRTAFAQQADQPSEPQKPPTLNKPSDQKPPTLGGNGEEAPLAGPHTPSTNDPSRLLRVRAIYINPMDNGLAEKLIEEIGSHGPFRIATNKQDADAELRGTCFDSTRLKTVHSEVFLTSRGGESIWQDVIRQPYRPPPLARAVGTTAEVIADDLAASVREAKSK
jgi:hypothetical protein